MITPKVRLCRGSWDSWHSQAETASGLWWFRDADDVKKPKCPGWHHRNHEVWPSDCFFETPEMEKGWQGNPATRISCFGMLPASLLVISSVGSCLKLVGYVRAAYLFHSDENTHSAPPAETLIESLLFRQTVNNFSLVFAVIWNSNPGYLDSTKFVIRDL